jgi:small-conductance mechanosensitive channel
MGFKSLFAVSGVSALFFSLVSKDLAEHIVGGLAVQVWDAFSVGETIILGNGLSGKVVSIGLVETEIECDNVITKIPNSKIVNERVSNISRATKSQVIQTLRFSYSDIKKVPKVLADIQGE